MNSSRKHLVSLMVWCWAALILLVRCGNCQESMILAENPEANTTSPVELNPDWPVIHTPSMTIGYEINSFNINDLERIELWCARGLSGRWQFYDYDQDRTSPVSFIAPAEGIYRFLVVAVDRWGRKSCQTNQNHDDASSHTLPDDLPAHLTVFIDYQLPQLTLLSPQGDIPDYQAKEIPIRWQGFDNHLDANPVYLYYQTQDNPNWIPLAGPLPARGEYMWAIPPQLKGPLVIQVLIYDYAGNQTIAHSGKIHPAPVQPTPDTLPATPVLSETPPAVPLSKTPDKVKDSQEEDAQEKEPLGNKEHSDLSGAPFQPKPKLPESKRLERASQCFSRGMMYCQQMEWPKAVEAFQESLENNPQSLNCRTNLANALFKMCRFEEALYQYQICLKEEPARSSALFGLAQTQIALKQHQNAQKTLTRLLEQDRRDWQAWLLYGDASQQLGNVSLAVNSWQQAAQGDANIARLAQERIKQYQP
ncbi:MAG: Tetratricopeptide repeat protein [Planctomycetes bacterium ADurb.Bin412]|nr:MAG: Tetratricopeptide repeat protein [Planctomycetes bacterium ADurb.Bin412]